MIDKPDRVGQRPRVQTLTAPAPPTLEITFKTRNCKSFVIEKVRFYLCYISMWVSMILNEVEMLVILQALRCFSRLFYDDFIVESESTNAIA